MGEARGGVDRSSGDEGHLFIASLTVAKIRRANVGPNELLILSVTWRRNQQRRREPCRTSMSAKPRRPSSRISAV
jgi:hypothetical protein